MEFRQLEQFLAVAEERHFTRAARRVHVVQSSLSSSIRALERELGVTLFTRDSRKVGLTEEGRALVPAARRALAAREEARAAVAGVRGLLRGTLTVGMIQSFGFFDVLAVLAEYHRRYPAVGLRIMHDSVGGLVRSVADGQLDLAFVDRPFGGERVRARASGAEPIVLAVPAADPLAARDRVALTELAEREFVEFRADSALRTRVDAACAAAGLDRRMCCEVDQISDLVDLVGHGVGIALLPAYAVRNATDRVTAVATDPEIPRESALITTAGREPSPATAALLELIEETAFKVKP
ncbi:LysR family transcriptional regulator [Sciscionella sediminilitoris]|uniref:LysR family transcriptional regulator n=1 Tax=Sciscionella sediminilitoris TaxID=1445613 RepID=UPI0004DF1B17|nr:LysR family transcriptional regulator [Sciscionella sp. SE31]